MIFSHMGGRFARAASLAACAALFALSSCGGGKESAPPPKKGSVPSIAGDWRSDIEAADRTIGRSHYRIDQTGDSASIRLVSTVSPLGDELVPETMSFTARGLWRGDALRLHASYWVLGRDTCTFELMGKMDPEGRLLLHFPADICGEKSLPYTRRLHRPE